jgi:calcineurin-like phosphoesterase family protein
MTDLSWVTLDTWIVSDHHWGHANIIKYQKRPPTNFADMRRLWIETVGADEPLLHLGDVACYGDRTLHDEWVKDLPGRKFLITGNHDNQHNRAWYEGHGFTILGRGTRPFFWQAPDGRMVAFSHEPDTTIFGWDINVHGHIHSNPYWSETPWLDYRNVCVELTGYAPVRLREVIHGKTYGSRFDAPPTSVYP